MSNTAEKIEIMQWHEDGNAVEVRDHSSDTWVKVVKENPTWDWSYNDYRKKPKHIECWVTILDGDTASTVHMNKENADAALYNSNIKDRWSVRKVVIE